MPDERVVSVSSHGSWASFAGRRGLLTAILTCLRAAQLDDDDAYTSFNLAPDFDRDPAQN